MLETPTLNLLVEANDLVLESDARPTPLSPISFQVRANEVLAIHGPRGAGQFAVLQAILGMSARFKGQLKHFCKRDAIGFFPQDIEQELEAPFTVQEVLEMTATVAPEAKKVEEIGLLDSEHLSWDWLEAPLFIKRRAMLTRILLGEHQLFVLENPFKGIEQQECERLASRFGDLCEQRGAAMVLTLESTMFESLPKDITASWRQILLKPASH